MTAATRSSKILGIAVTIAAPYAEGHTLSANEAQVLNQVRAENVGNNMRAEVKKLKEGGKSEKDVQSAVSAYDNEYDLNTASSRRGGMSDEERLCRSIATDQVNRAIIGSGKTVKEVKEGNIEGYKALVLQTAADENVVKAAQKHLADLAKSADAGPDVSGL